MREVYIIFSVAGWAWAIVFLAFLWLRLRRSGRAGEAPAEPLASSRTYTPARQEPRPPAQAT